MAQVGNRFGMWRQVAVAWFGAALTALSGLAAAQEAVSNDDGVAALACLVKTAEPLAYSEEDRERGVEGLVRVKLTFTDPAQAPAVEVLYGVASTDMVDSVRRHVRSYRLPCLTAGRSVEAVQEFDFNARGGQPIRWTGLRNSPRTPRADLLACLRTPEKAPTLMASMQQTGSHIKRRAFGNIIVSLRFEKPDAAPSVKVLYDKVDNVMRMAVMAHVATFRLPCLPADGEPFVVEHQFGYENGDAQQLRLNDAGLVPFLRGFKDLEQRPVRFNLDTMACPFQVVWRLGRPAMANRVGEVGAPNPNRAEFLAWLTELTMDLPSDQFERLLGKSMVVTVPCGKIELG